MDMKSIAIKSLLLLIILAIPFSFTYAQYPEELREEVRKALESATTYSEPDGYTHWSKREDGTIVEYYFGSKTKVRNEFTPDGKRTVYGENGNIIFESTSTGETAYSSDGKIQEQIEGSVYVSYDEKGNPKQISVIGSEGESANAIEANEQGDLGYSLPYKGKRLTVYVANKTVTDYSIPHYGKVYRKKGGVEQLIKDGEVKLEYENGKRTKGGVFAGILYSIGKIFTKPPEQEVVQSIYDQTFGGII